MPKNLLYKNGTDYKYGARPLRRTIQNLVEDKIAEKMLDDGLLENKKIILKEENEKIIIE